MVLQMMKRAEGEVENDMSDIRLQELALRERFHERETDQR